MENIVRFYCENGRFRNVRVQNENLSWSKIRALARGVSPARRRGGGAHWGGGVGISRVSAKKIFYLYPFVPGFVLKRIRAN